jgi:AraC-like DNA-binding protein
MSRPRKAIDPVKVKQLAGMGLTGEEIASVLGCSKDTLERRFAAALKEGRMRLNASLKRTQFRMSRKHVVMAIWLGKQYLGQRDQPPATPAEGDGRPRLIPALHDGRFKPPDPS